MIGLVQVYTGDGKGKTTAALGQAYRAIGHGMSAYMVQFLKNKADVTGELLTTREIPFDFTISPFGVGGFVTGEPSDADRDGAKECLACARLLTRLGCDLVVLDEVSHAINLGLISVEDVLSVIKTKKPHVEIILTGRDMPQELIDIADLVTEMKCVKHPHNRGIAARKGIEF